MAVDHDAATKRWALQQAILAEGRGPSLSRSAGGQPPRIMLRQRRPDRGGLIHYVSCFTTKIIRPKGAVGCPTTALGRPDADDTERLCSKLNARLGLDSDAWMAVAAQSMSTHSGPGTSLPD